MIFTTIYPKLYVCISWFHFNTRFNTDTRWIFRRKGVANFAIELEVSFSLGSGRCISWMEAGCDAAQFLLEEIITKFDKVDQ